ncbi:MAG TPA: CZB domain-containing protein [Candidatus Acidoferrales bacterium]|jgi:hypothetical protein|nr:CZB domain-containing protein [Candidatus Acidoferrales bacterium]
MNFDSAISAHTQWKAKLASYISKPDHSLNPAAVAAHNGCELGKWLDGEGKKYSSLPEYSALVSDHNRFHKAAAEVVKKADAGQKVAEDVALGSHSDFANASSAVVKALMAMKLKS